MRKENIAPDLTNLAFDFFYWFSRFEFALKENGYLKSHKQGNDAEPGWKEFVDKWQTEYCLSDEAKFLLTSPPGRQIVGAADALDWKPVDLRDHKSDLSKVVRLLKTVRNNLFHGGKHGGEGWDDPERTRELMTAGTVVLSQLAELGSFVPDYTQYY